jgi:fatty acid desaturase
VEGTHDAALQALVDVTRKRIAAIEDHSAPTLGEKFGRALIEGVYAAILAVTMGAWTVAGFVIWVPLLIRTTAFLAATVFYVSLFRDLARLAQAQGRVHFAVRFYPQGFEHFQSFYRKRGEPEQPVGLLEPLTSLTRRELLIEIAWVVTLWALLVFSIRAAIAALFGGPVV